MQVGRNGIKVESLELKKPPVSIVLPREAAEDFLKDIGRVPSAKLVTCDVYSLLKQVLDS